MSQKRVAFPEQEWQTNKWWTLFEYYVNQLRSNVLLDSRYFQ